MLLNQEINLKLTKKNNNGIKYFECRGCWHIQSEGANVVKKNKLYNTAFGDDTYYDTQPKSDEEDSQVNNVLFRLQYESGNKTPTCVNIDALINNYIVIKAENVKLLEENAQINALCQKLKQDLQQKTTQHEKTVGKLEEVEKYMEELNKGKIKLDEIMESGKSFRDLTGLGYVNSVIKKCQSFAHLSLKTSSPSYESNKGVLIEHQSCNGGTITFDHDVRKSTFAISDVNKEEGSLPLHSVK
ncbi:hypothetical protein M9H77_06831 [Catharanthus roseus]|uniref:Uncharacterized protein n=1 Tax=Catharanthus roseus TaxID=4058 RepID=A0ACC0BTF6_CATRO|nr:hypothetical protein M9H77_06831 [Catharanthus roseus]